MSYDLRFAVKVDGHEGLYAVIGEPEANSPTYNIGEMFRKCMGWDFKQSEWYRVTDVLPNIEKGIHELRFNPKKYKKYEPENGWGTVGSALEALESIVAWLTGWDGLGGSWNADIPIDCIYISW